MLLGRRRKSSAILPQGATAGPAPRFARVAISSVGLLGGSLGLALRRRGLAGHVVGVGRDAGRLEQARELGAIDSWTLKLREACAQADLIILCGPISTIYRQVYEAIEAAPAGAVITDVGSTKRSIVERAAARVRDGVHFIGSHPMAGSEKSGVAHATADLFEGATVVLTPDLTTSDLAVETARELWSSLGMKVIEMLPARHDRVVAMVSHLPHLVAAGLMEVVQHDPAEDLDQARSVAAGGFRDTTRVAMGNAEVWADIFLDNNLSVVDSLDSLLRVLEDLRRAIVTSNRPLLERILRRSAALRETFNEAGGGKPATHKGGR